MPQFQSHTDIATYFEGFLTGLDALLSEAPTPHAAAFGLARAERALPCYDAFCSMEEVGQGALLRATLDELWGRPFKARKDRRRT